MSLINTGVASDVASGSASDKAAATGQIAGEAVADTAGIATAEETALHSWLSGAASRAEIATAVRYTLGQFAHRNPGRSVEVRVPPFAAVQVIEGVAHRRGTPPAVVETDAQTWLELSVGQISWAQACADGRIDASGERADLSALLPHLSQLSHPQ